VSDILKTFHEVLRERASIPVPHKRVDRSMVQTEPAYVAPIENLYGVPLFDLMEGYKGQIVGLELIHDYTDARHQLPTIGYRFRLGSSVVFATPPDERVPPMPVVVFGVATPLIDVIKQYRNVRFSEYYAQAGRRFDVAQDDILNLLDVSTGEAAVLVTDKSGLRELGHVSQARRIAELNNLIEMLSRELQESKLREEEARTTARIANGLAESYRSMLHEARNQMSNMLVEYAAMSGELQRLFSDMRRRLEELSVQEAISERLKATMEAALGTTDTIINRLQRYQQIIDEAVRRLGIAEAEGGEAKK
jgi:hypothetical protein